MAPGLRADRKEVYVMSEVLALQLLADEEVEADLPISTFSFFNCSND
jgi:hypothetical protein